MSPSNGWKEYNGKCYKYLDDRKTFVDAEYFCNLIDGNLVAINSQDEQDFLQTYQITIELDYWIGLTDKVSRRSFQDKLKSWQAFFDQLCSLSLFLKWVCW